MTRGAGPAVRGTLHAAAVAVAAAGAATLLTGCGASPAALGPTGVDGLTIPTPTPDPADFTGGVDNPWFPLRPGSSWTYRRYTDLDTTTLVATVLPGTTRVDGVPTTAVRWQRRNRGRPATTLAVLWYAEDRAGNVWWFGQRVTGTPRVDRLAPRSWRAGRGGARPGVVMTAAPRDGDGYANGFQTGVVERHSTVLTLDASVALPHGHYRHTVETQDRSPLVPLLIGESFYARGVGLVATQAVQAVHTDLSLVAFHRG